LSGAWTAEQAAQFHLDAGEQVVEKDGTFWITAGSRFWHPVDFLEPRPGPCRRPVPTALGYHHLVSEHGATVCLPLQIIPDLPGLTTDRLSANIYKDLRTSRHKSHVAQLAEPDLLLAQGYEVWRDAAHRSGQSLPSSASAFTRQILARWGTGPQIVIAAQRDGLLGGFLLAHVIGRTCMFEEVVIATRARPWRLGVAMYWAALQQAKAMGAQVAYLGLPTPENPGLQRFKARMGARLTWLPGYSWVNPGARLWLRTFKPLALTRLGGHSVRVDRSPASLDTAPAAGR
jgi:hypothetical protein